MRLISLRWTVFRCEHFQMTHLDDVIDNCAHATVTKSPKANNIFRISWQSRRWLIKTSMKLFQNYTSSFDAEDSMNLVICQSFRWKRSLFVVNSKSQKKRLLNLRINETCAQFICFKWNLHRLSIVHWSSPRTLEIHSHRMFEMKDRALQLIM